MKYYGLDITQHKEIQITARLENERFICSSETLPQFLPAVLLPVYKRENIVLASDCQNSRKGMGLLWPREAQIPVGGGSNWKNGVGRVPLLTCLCNLKTAGGASEWEFIESTISWTPQANQQPLVFSNAKLIAELFPRIKDVSKVCFVIPDTLSESAQHILMESLPDNVLLIPSSIALAVKWCKDHQMDYQDIKAPCTLGYLICASLGFGEWEVSLIEIQIIVYDNRNHLIPIFNPSLGNHGIGFCGISLCSQLLINPNDSFTLWQILCNEDWFEKKLSSSLNINIIKQIFKILRDSSYSQIPFPELDVMKGLCKLHNLKGDVKQRIDRIIQMEHQRISGDNHRILGAVVSGSFAKVSLNTNTIENKYEVMSENELRRYASYGIPEAVQEVRRRKIARNPHFIHGNLNSSLSLSYSSIAHYLFSSWEQQKKLYVYDSDAIAQGAAIASYCIGENLPAFKTKLLPLSLYSITRDNRGDKSEKWECLVAEQTINAGETYLQPEPITGLFIPEGKEHLELTLRRPGLDNKSMMYRSVIAKIPQKTDRKERVVINTQVKAGQGFAKVIVLSERQGVFSTFLDWRTMREVPEPKLQLEYIPDVAYIDPDLNLWNNVQQLIERFVLTWEQKHRIEDQNCKDLNKHLNRWRWQKDNSIYRHIGAINSDGIFDKLLNQSLMRKFIKSLSEAWLLEKNLTLKHRLLRIGGWLYLFIPSVMLQETEKALKTGEEKSFHLHVAGLTFHTDSQFILFYTAFHNKTKHNAEWFRALRNMIRFRDNALSDDILTSSQINYILQCIINNLSNSDEKKKYNNSIEVLIYLLKRRRYDIDFLASSDENTKKLHDLLQNIACSHPTEKYRKIASNTLFFLDKIATINNLTAILEADNAEEDEDD